MSDKYGGNFAFWTQLPQHEARKAECYNQN